MRTRQGSFHARVLAAAFLAMAACVPAGATVPRAGVPEPVDVAWPGTLVLARLFIGAHQPNQAPLAFRFSSILDKTIFPLQQDRDCFFGFMF